MFILYLPDYRQQAVELALTLGCEVFAIADDERKTLLACAAKGELAILLNGSLSLQPLTRPLPNAVSVDWADKSLLWRLQHGGGRGEMIAKACGVKKDLLPTIVDATAGFGKDSLLLAVASEAYERGMRQLEEAVAGLGVDWLPRLEAAARAYAREGAIAFTVGMALAERQLWGKAARLLEDSAADPSLPSTARRRAWLMLARIAAAQDDGARAARAYEAAASVN